MNKWVFINEIKAKWKIYLIWIVIWLLYGAMFLSFFETIREQSDELAAFLEALPQEFRQGTNIDLERTYTEIESYIASEFFITFVLVSCLFMAYQGAKVIAGEISSKSIIFWAISPIKRTTFYIEKTLGALTLLFITNTAIALAFWVMVELFTKQSASVGYLLSLFYGCGILAAFMFLFGNLVALIVGSGKGAGVALAFGFFTWLLDFLSTFEGFPEFLKYFSPYHYFNVNHVIDHGVIDLNLIWPIIAGIVLMYIGGIFVYRIKDLHS